MALLIDASVFITLERRGHRIEHIGSVASNESLALAIITVAEL